jgi:aminoglycoside phosphotransferase (APT) family kinase protein
MTDDSEMVTPAGLAVVTPITMTQEQLNQILQQLHRPPTTSNPEVEDPELYYGERAKPRAFLTQCELKFNCKMNKFDME